MKGRPGDGTKVMSCPHRVSAGRSARAAGHRSKRCPRSWPRSRPVPAPGEIGSMGEPHDRVAAPGEMGAAVGTVPGRAGPPGAVGTGGTQPGDQRARRGGRADGGWPRRADRTVGRHHVGLPAARGAGHRPPGHRVRRHLPGRQRDLPGHRARGGRDRRGRRRQLRRRRDHRDSPGDAGVHPALPVRPESRGDTRSVRRQSGRRESGRPWNGIRRGGGRRGGGRRGGGRRGGGRRGRRSAPSGSLGRRRR